jgi:hypothetical protein
MVVPEKQKDGLIFTCTAGAGLVVTLTGEGTVGEGTGGEPQLK